MDKRIYKFDNLKFLLILLVVIGHIVENYVEIYLDEYDVMRKVFIFVYSFHMPLFIFLSGLFQKKVYKFEKLPLKKLCYYFYLIIITMTLVFLSNYPFNNKVSISLLGSYDLQWYLFALIIYTLLVPIMSKLNLKLLFIMSLLLGCFIGHDNGIGDYLYLSRTIVFFPFFCLGFYYSDKKDKLIKFTNNIIIKIISVAIIVIFFYICYKELDFIWRYKMLFTGKNAFILVTKIKNCYYIHRLITYAISTLVGFSVLCITPNKKIKVITKLGKRTLQVYVFHRLIINLLRNNGVLIILEKEFNLKYVFVLILIGIIITLFLSIKIFKNILDKLYTTMFDTSNKIIIKRND